MIKPKINIKRLSVLSKSKEGKRKMNTETYRQNPVLVEARETMVKVIHAGYSLWDLDSIRQDAFEQAIRENLARAL